MWSVVAAWQLLIRHLWPRALQLQGTEWAPAVVNLTLDLTVKGPTQTSRSKSGGNRKMTKKNAWIAVLATPAVIATLLLLVGSPSVKASNQPAANAAVKI